MHEEDATKFADQIASIRQELKSVRLEYGFVLKAIEELLIEKGSLTASEIQRKIMDLTAQGWRP